MEIPPDLRDAVSLIPPGRWAVGVSGGADSVALLLLLVSQRQDVFPHVVHLDHEARGADSAADAEFVRALASRLSLPNTVARWRDVAPSLVRPPRNPSARFRAGRMAVFGEAVRANGLLGVLLAHHADDSAETVLQRLLRGSGAAGLTGIAPRGTVNGLTIVRPLLGVRGAALRQWLLASGQDWREDESNRSPKYLRNRLRGVLAANPALTPALRALAQSCGELKRWVTGNAPAVGEQLPVGVLRDLPPSLAREVARRWLAARGVPRGELSAKVLNDLREMAEDAATPARRHFPGGVLVRRRRGTLSADSGAGGA